MAKVPDFPSWDFHIKNLIKDTSSNNFNIDEFKKVFKAMKISNNLDKFNEVEHNQKYFIHYMCRNKKYIDIVKKCIKYSNIINIDILDNDEYSPLYMAIRSCNYDVVKMLLESGKININRTFSKSGNNLLHIAVQNTTTPIEIIKLLIKCGVDTNYRNKLNVTPSEFITEYQHIARNYERNEKIKYLLVND